MTFAIVWIVSLIIVSGAILFGLYMHYCYEDSIKMFDNHSYEKEMIGKLEKRIKIVEDKL